MGKSKRKVAVVMGGTAAAAAAVPLVSAGQVDAAGFEVTNLNDSGAGSLRQAILDANAAAGPDVITFQSGLTGTIVLTSGQLVVASDVTITGPGSSLLTVSGNDSSRVFYTRYTPASGSLFSTITIAGLTMTHGAGNDKGGGGALHTLDVRLTLDDVVISDSTTTGKGGGLFSDGFNSTLTVIDSTVTGNTAGTDGGGIYVEDTETFAGAETSSVVISGSTISGNTAGVDGGGIYFYDPDDSVEIHDSTISGNTATSGKGGGVYLYNIDNLAPFTIEGTTISGNKAVRGGGVWEYSVTGIIDSSTISGNIATADGGGINLSPDMFAVNVRHSTIVDNLAGTTGGGIVNGNGGLTLDHSIVANNTAPADADVSGAPVGSTTYSLVESSGVPLNADGGSILAADPQLGPLADNGGPNKTHLPTSSASPVVNNGNPGIPTPPATDERGVARIVGAAIDIGAVEVQAPADDDYVTDEDTTLNVLADGVRANDGEAAAVTEVVTDVAHGTLTLNADGSFTYVPDAGYHGPDSFVYRTPFGDATVELTVNPVVDPPTDDDYATDEDTTLNVLADGVLGNDIDGGPVTGVVTDVGHGTLTLNTDGSFTYVPDANYHGPDSFVYSTAAGNATVNLTVDPIADAPTGDSYDTDEDTTLDVVAPGVLVNDADAGTVTGVVTDVAHGTLTLNADGSFTFVPDANYHGPDSFVYSTASGNATVHLTVNPVNDPPEAATDTATAGAGSALTIQVIGNDDDADGDPVTIVSVTQGAKGTVVINGNSVVYTPNSNASGADSFTYTISDGELTSTATVNVTITRRQIPSTGGDQRDLALVALGLLTVGGALVLARRRRPNRA